MSHSRLNFIIYFLCTVLSALHSNAAVLSTRGCNAACQNNRKHNPPVHQSPGPIGSIWITDWSTTQVCYTQCHSKSDGAFQMIQINGDQFTLGAQVTITMYRKGDYAVLWSENVAATAYAGFDGGSFGVQVNMPDCGNVYTLGDRPVVDAFVTAYDTSTLRSSGSVDVQTGCLS